MCWLKKGTNEATTSRPLRAMAKNRTLGRSRTGSTPPVVRGVACDFHTRKVYGLSQ